MSNDEHQPEFAADSGGSGNRRIRISAGAAEPGRGRPLILYKEAREEARQLGHNFVDTEHFLIALARYQEDISAKAMLAFGLNVNTLRSAAEEFAPASIDTCHGEMNITPQARSAQDGAWDEALKLQHVTVGPEHLLLAILYQQVGIASRILDASALDRKELRTQIFKLMRVGNQ